MRNEETKAKAAILIVAIVGICFALMFATSCRSQQHFGTHESDSTRIVERIDTFIMHTRDSVIMQMPCSDSIEVAYVDRWHTNTIYKKSISHDTISTYRLDSVPYPVEVEKVVVKNSRTATFALWYMWISLVAIVAAIALYIYRKFFLP